MPEVAYPAQTKQPKIYHPHPYPYAHGYAPYHYAHAPGPWAQHGYGYPYYYNGEKYSPRQGYAEGPFNYKYQPSKTIEVDLDDQA